jgi:small subunit ribosomal protein S24e
VQVRIISQKYNPLLKRQEVVFEVDHAPEGQTTPRAELRRRLAELLKTRLDLTFVEKVETKTGTMTALGTANAYDTTEQAKAVEREHIIARNIPAEKPEEKAAAEPPAPEKPPQEAPKPEEKGE